MRRSICPSARAAPCVARACKRTLAHSTLPHCVHPFSLPRQAMLQRNSILSPARQSLFHAPSSLARHPRIAPCIAVRPAIRTYATSFSYDELIRQIPNPRKFTTEKADYGWAGIVESRDQQTIDETIEKLHKKYGTEIAVVTLVSLPTKNSLEYREFATRLFNAWGIGNAQRDNGVLILLIRENRRLEVVTGTGLSTTLPPSWLHDFQNTELVGPLGRGDYSMTVVAIGEVVEESERKWRKAQPKPKETEKEGGFLRGLAQLSLLLAAFAGVLLWQWRQEDKNDESRTCKFCGGEVKSDISRILSHTDAQAIEQQLGAAVYEAGSCTGCRRTQNIRHPQLHKGDVRKCDYCHYYTAVQSESYVVDDKAQKRTRVLTNDCHNCQQKSFKEEPVAYQSSSTGSEESSPYSSSDSSSSSTGFGGGSSTGGGSGMRF